MTAEDTTGKDSTTKQKKKLTRKERKRKCEKQWKHFKLTYPEHYGLLDVRIGRLIAAHGNPYSDKPCYLHNIEVGEHTQRLFVSDLPKFYTPKQLERRPVVVVCNTFPYRKHHVSTEGWILCANNGKTLELLKPPVECEEGDLVTVEGYPTNPKADIQPEPRRPALLKIFKDLRVNSERIAVYKGIPLKVNGRPITTETLNDCPITDALPHTDFPPIP